jgi:subtilisin family serine protease
LSKITINGVSLDPATDASSLSHHALLAADASSSDYLLIQTHGPLTAEQKAQLKQTGAVALEYVPTDTYVCRYAPSDLTAVRALPFVAWAHVYLQGFKIAPELHAGASGPRAALLDLRGLASPPHVGAHLVDIVLHRDVDPATVADAIAAAAGVDPADLTPARGKFRLRVETDRLAAIAAIDQVRSVEPVKDKQLWNDKARALIGADLVQAGSTLEGEGQIIAVCDTGFDKGSAASPHPAFEGRVLKLYPLGRKTASDPNGHGTHVCGSVLGDGESKTAGRIRGTAPRAKLVMQSVLDPRGGLGGLPDDLHQIFEPAYNDGARVHSNSWGDSNNAYTQESHDVDSFVWDHRDAVIVFAAGNAGSDDNGDGVIDPGSLGSPATAKNCITVGASENNRPDFAYVDGTTRILTYGQGWARNFPVDPLHGDKLADGPNGLAAFSSRGPTSDGRIKPDVVAPGTGILSARSRATGVGNGWGPSEDPLYFYEGGTSMATPLVSGCAAVVREHLHTKDLKTPSAALVKAILINGADPLPGQYTPNECGPVPNSNQGFGRVNLAASVDALANNQLLQLWDEDRKLDTGDEQVFTVALDAAAHTVRVTLVWTDPAGETLQNDLDLAVTAAGATTLGNAAAGSTVADRTNNVEQVTLTNVAAGPIAIKVKAFRAAIEPQPFALVARAIR